MHSSDPAIDVAARLEALAGALRSVRELAPSHVIRGVFTMLRVTKSTVILRTGSLPPLPPGTPPTTAKMGQFSAFLDWSN